MSTIFQIQSSSSICQKKVKRDEKKDEIQLNFPSLHNEQEENFKLTFHSMHNDDSNRTAFLLRQLLAAMKSLAARAPPTLGDKQARGCGSVRNFPEPRKIINFAHFI